MKFFQSGQTFFNRIIDERQKGFYFFKSVHNFDGDQQIFRKPQNLGDVNPALCAKPFQTAVKIYWKLLGIRWNNPNIGLY